MRVIPDEVVARQREASDPSLSAWVSANAGSGKTYVLAQRVIRLLLDGSDPAKILCLTFTKAAAANMANRVFDMLAAWTACDDATLDAAMRAMGVTAIDAALRARARKLFALALETPGGLKVQTIHALCTRLLQQFPFEANVAARFAVLDERTEAELLDRAQMSVLLDAAATPDSAFGEALAVATAAVADATFKQVIGEALTLRHKLQAWIALSGGVDAAVAGLPFGIAADDSLARVEAEIVDGPHLPIAAWPALAARCDTGSANDRKQGQRLSAAAGGDDRIETYLSVFFTAESEPRDTLLTKALVQRQPDLARLFADEQARLIGLTQRRRAVRARDRTRALLTIAHAVIGRYRSEKERRGLLDYDDLIERTLDLLDKVEAAWVHYKLDRGVDHVLIDEAQDTSPKQWQIIAHLVAEFSAGAGARDALRRTIFAVGDDKQSIFSFQGASPESFAEKRGEFKRAYDASGLTFLPVELKYSFRSLQVILDAVDTVFGQPAAFAGLSTDAVATAHSAVRAELPGQVEIWPLEKPQPRAAVTPWTAPFDTTTETSPRTVLAGKIATAIKTWIGRGDRVGDDRHAIRPGDVLILVRQRGPLFEAVIRALKNAGVPVAGADRLVLTDHIAVMDLMVLADALLLPNDDLALATALKSPLFGLSEDDLFSLAWQRPGALRDALQAARAPQFTAAWARLDRLGDHARGSPFAFYAHLLGAEQGRARLLARLGPEAIDALDEFLELALDYERRETPSLQGFVAWLRAANAVIKRDMEITRDEVRVMTVHGAKGLEAPVVILADTTTPAAGPSQRAPRLLSLDRSDAIVWATRREDDLPAMTTARAAAATAAENEHRRLLYVAMTRAADRLVICGAGGEREIAADSWYRLVSDALRPLCSEEPADAGEGSVWRWRKLPPDRGATAPPSAAPAAAEPAWLRQAVAAAATAPRAVSPSRLFEDNTAAPVARDQALLRGRAVHRLLQSLPELAPSDRADTARRFVARSGLPEHQQDALVARVMAILDDARFAPLFAAGSRAEVAIVGTLRTGGETRPIRGQLDRLVVTETDVLIADYKTGTAKAAADAPHYVAQLALYREVLKTLYPGRRVRAALVFVDEPELLELSDTALDAALAQM